MLAKHVYTSRLRVCAAALSACLLFACGWVDSGVGGNKPPVTTTSDYVVQVGGVLTVDRPEDGVLADNFDIGGRSLTAEPWSDPSHGALTLDTDGTFVYRHDGSDSTADSFEYRAYDGIDYSEPEAVTIRIAHPPQAVDDRATARPGESVFIEVLANDRAPHDAIDPPSLSIVDPPSHGSYSVEDDGRVRYTPNAGAPAEDRFRYRVANTSGFTSEPATVTIRIRQPPRAVDDVAETRTGIPVTIDVLANDRDPDGNLDPRSVTVVSDPEHGSAAPTGDGRVRYTPNSGFIGTDRFTYQVADTEGFESNEATVTVTVRLLLPPPTPVPEPQPAPPPAPEPPPQPAPPATEGPANNGTAPAPEQSKSGSAGRRDGSSQQTERDQGSRGDERGRDRRESRTEDDDPRDHGRQERNRDADEDRRDRARDDEDRRDRDRDDDRWARDDDDDNDNERNRVLARDDDFEVPFSGVLQVSAPAGVLANDVLAPSDVDVGAAPVALIVPDLGANTAPEAVLDTPPAFGQLDLQPDGGFSYVAHDPVNFQGDRFVYRLETTDGVSSSAGVDIRPLEATSEACWVVPVTGTLHARLPAAGPVDGGLWTIHKQPHFGEVELANAITGELVFRAAQRPPTGRDVFEVRQTGNDDVTYVQLVYAAHLLVLRDEATVVSTADQHFEASLRENGHIVEWVDIAQMPGYAEALAREHDRNATTGTPAGLDRHLPDFILIPGPVEPGALRTLLGELQRWTALPAANPVTVVAPNEPATAVQDLSSAHLRIVGMASAPSAENQMQTLGALLPRCR